MNFGPNALYMLIGLAGLTVVTVVTRASFFALPARINLPSGVERLLRYAPACALAAIIAPGILARGGHLHVTLGNHYLWASIAATLVFLRWRNMMAMITVGLLVLTVLRLYA